MTKDSKRILKTALFVFICWAAGVFAGLLWVGYFGT